MLIDTVTLPSDLRPEHLAGRAVVVFDVLRATSVITTAVAHGAARVRVYEEVQEARDAAAAFDGPKLLAGERNSVKPDGFDYGNSPSDYTPDRVAGRTLFMTTTNGTHALGQARSADPLYVAAILNAGAMADHLATLGMDATLICSGTNRLFSVEDFIGAGAVADAVAKRVPDVRLLDATLAARSAYLGAAADLEAVFREGHGGHNIRRDGDPADIAHCAVLNCLSVVARVRCDGAGLYVEKDDAEVAGSGSPG